MTHFRALTMPKSIAPASPPAIAPSGMKVNQHPAVAFKVADVENFGVSEAEANAEDRAQYGSQDESDKCE